jgi:two-component system response regulator YesN
MKILIVDDDRFVIAALKKKIKWDELGFSDVLSAHSMSDAQKLIVSDSPEIIITDINMPQGSGLDLLAWIKEHRKNMISILLTSYADFEYAQKAIELGAFNYVLKPIDSEEITKIILSAVKESFSDISARRTAAPSTLSPPPSDTFSGFGISEKYIVSLFPASTVTVCTSAISFSR